MWLRSCTLAAGDTEVMWRGLCWIRPGKAGRGRLLSVQLSWAVIQRHIVSRSVHSWHASCAHAPLMQACGGRKGRCGTRFFRPPGRSRAFFGWATSTKHPPVARVGDGDDPYAWLQNGNEREVKAYLEAENRYCKSVLKPVKKLERQLFRAMSDRLDEEENSDPEQIEKWYYYMRTREGSAFPIYCRKNRLEGGAEEVLLDQDEMSTRVPYLMVPQCKISPCHTKLAYTADTTGAECYTGFVKDLRSGEIICKVPDVTTLEWATDGKTILYTQPDQHRRPCQLWRRFLSGEGRDELILEEEDPAFYMDVGLSKDKRWITISINSKTSSEVRLIRSSDPWSAPRMIQPRLKGLEYFVEHCRGQLVIVTNDQEALDYKIVQAEPPEADADKDGLHGSQRTAWRDLFLPEAGCKIEDIDVFAEQIAVYERTAHGQQLRILDLDGGDPAEDNDSMPHSDRPLKPPNRGLVVHSASCGFPHVTLDAPPPRGQRVPSEGGEKGEGRGRGGGGLLCVQANTLVELPDKFVGTCIQPGANCDYYGSKLRLILSSPLSPSTVLDVSLRGDTDVRGHGRKRITVLRQRKCAGFGAHDFVCRQEWATSHDGTRVPMTVMHRKDLAHDGTRPALLIVYGGYGQCLDTDFDVGRLVLMERGWSVVLCHVRGGGELGARWHAAGKGPHKFNSFLDLRACVAWVSQEARLSSAPRIALHTASAGGLVVGAFLNMFPGAVGAAVVKVPFVDMANTMLDPSLPLTVHEYDEWGCANDADVAAYLRSYSPYDNVKTGGNRTFPALYVTGAYKDTRVGYWEPAKWVARIRASSADAASGPIVLCTSMEGGHFGTGGAGGNIKDFAREVAFLHLGLSLPLDDVD